MTATLPFETLRSTTSPLNFPCTSIAEGLSCHQPLSDIPILSFFTGAGFLDLGFAQAGFNIQWRNESNPTFVAGFQYAMAHNSPNSHAHQITNTTSIEDLSATTIADEAFHRTARPSTFGIIGGPPCPDFATGGKNKGKIGDHGRLSQVFVDRILALQPSFFLFENVPGLLRTEKHRAFLAELIGQFMPNYHIELRVLNALDFGIPQNRERVFLIGFSRQWLKLYRGEMPPPKPSAYLFELSRKHGGIATAVTFGDTPWFPWPIDQRYTESRTRFIWPTISADHVTPQMPKDIPLELMVGPLICDQAILQALPNGQEGFLPKSAKFATIAEGDVSGKSFKRLHRWRYSPSAAYGNNEIHIHPTENRRLTVREALRIQSVPDTYVLPPDLSLTSKFKMISNGVPVKLANAIGLAFVKTLGNF